jgi:hypothetical protein
MKGNEGQGNYFKEKENKEDYQPAKDAGPGHL